MANSAAMAIASVFVYASGLKSRPSWSTSVNTGRNATAMTNSEKKHRRTHIHDRLETNLVEVALSSFFVPALEFFIGVFDFDNRTVHEHADGDGDAGQAHDVGGDAHEVHRDERQRDRDWNCNDGH